jgi:hypothetical protein
LGKWNGFIEMKISIEMRILNTLNTSPEVY